MSNINRTIPAVPANVRIWEPWLIASGRFPVQHHPDRLWACFAL